MGWDIGLYTDPHLITPLFQTITSHPHHLLITTLALITISAMGTALTRLYLNGVNQKPDKGERKKYPMLIQGNQSNQGRP